ncbi:MAG TPA: branched-chain amino acid ABC transporter permease [Rhodoblastus sp.]|nr:branched-chain amino acid ABC transporter permease [Rhodoblastus sp.]
MKLFAELLASGVAIGAIYGLIAMGFAVIYKSTGLVNFAQGEMSMITAYVAWTISTTLTGNPFVVIAGAIVFAMLFGLLIERFVTRPMLGEPIFSTVLVTVALAVILRSLITLVWDAYPHALNLGVGRDVIQLAGVSLRGAQVAAVVTLVAAMAAFYLFFRFSKFGVAMRAVAADDRTALLMGVSAARIHAIAWACSSAIAGVAGVLFALVYDLSPAMFQIGLKAFPATILGGLDSVIGSGFGGVIIGVVENMAGGYVGSGLKDVAGFLVIIVILMVQPFGLFGEREIVRV